MTITLNLLEIARFVFIAGWLVAGTFLGVMQGLVGDAEGRAFSLVFAVFAFGSALVLYLGK